MTLRSSDGRRDIALAVAILAFSALVYWQALDLPPPRYEPMGSAALPKALSVIMAVLALLLMARALWPRSAKEVEVAAPIEKSADPTPGITRRPWLAGFTFAATAAYVAVLDLKLLGYPLATALYLAASCLMLTRGDRRQWRWIVPFAIGLSLVCYLVFTRIFYIDLS